MALFICAAFEVGKNASNLRGSLHSLLESMFSRSPESSASLVIAGLRCLVLFSFDTSIYPSGKEKNSYGAFCMIKTVLTFFFF